MRQRIRRQQVRHRTKPGVFRAGCGWLLWPAWTRAIADPGFFQTLKGRRRPRHGHLRRCWLLGIKVDPRLGKTRWPAALVTWRQQGFCLKPGIRPDDKLGEPDAKPRKDRRRRGQILDHDRSAEWPDKRKEQWASMSACSDGGFMDEVAQFIADNLRSPVGEGARDNAKSRHSARWLDDRRGRPDTAPPMRKPPASTGQVVRPATFDQRSQASRGTPQDQIDYAD